MKGFSVEVVIEADVHHAWEYYFNQINGWWPKEFFTSSKSKRFIIDTFIGGKVYEDHGEGCGLVWGDIIGVDYPSSLQIRGHLTREFGGPTLTFEKFTFIPHDQGAKVRYEIEFVGPIETKSISSLQNGWEDLLQRHFKSYCKKKES